MFQHLSTKHLAMTAIVSDEEQEDNKFKKKNVFGRMTFKKGEKSRANFIDCVHLSQTTEENLRQPCRQQTNTTRTGQYVI